MLLRLQVKNFKNLRDVDVRFGPLNCFVGPNGVGKSNVFDAIQFLRALADTDINSAAQQVRSPQSGSFDPLDLVFDANQANEMAFAANMLVRQDVIDDFGRAAHPATTLLRYELGLRYLPSEARLELTKESLVGLKMSEARDAIGFPQSAEFRKSTLKPTRRTGPLISYESSPEGVRLLLHQDGGSRGRAVPAGRSPRTVLGGTNAAEYPTVLAARREMASWQFLQLEPSVMRTPDAVGGPNHVDERGGHIAATLARLAAAEEQPGTVYARAANDLASLVPEVRGIRVDRDEARQQLSVRATVKGCAHELGPRSVSDGTLRYLALVTMQMDPDSGDVLCMEEPENGMHPSRMPDMVGLLRDFVVDPSMQVDAWNPARQVILNTHSPDVVRQLDPSEVLFIETLEGPEGRSARIAAVAGEWRKGGQTAPYQRLVDFIGGAPIGQAMRQRNLPFVFGTAQ